MTCSTAERRKIEYGLPSTFRVAWLAKLSDMMGVLLERGEIRLLILSAAASIPATDGRFSSANHSKSARHFSACRFKMFAAIDLPPARERLAQMDRVWVMYVCV